MLVCWSFTFQYYPQLSWYLLIWLGEPEQEDFKENNQLARKQKKIVLFHPQLLTLL